MYLGLISWSEPDPTVSKLGHELSSDLLIRPRWTSEVRFVSWTSKLLASKSSDFIGTHGDLTLSQFQSSTIWFLQGQGRWKMGVFLVIGTWIAMLRGLIFAKQVLFWIQLLQMTLKPWLPPLTCSCRWLWVEVDRHWFMRSDKISFSSSTLWCRWLVPHICCGWWWCWWWINQLYLIFSWSSLLNLLVFRHIIIQLW